MTPINRQSYMAEISSLLGLITDENTREVLIAKMERMFDAADDEQALIEDIGSPTKVAVALIRYADNGVVTPEAAAVIETVTADDAGHEDFDTLEALDEQPELLIPEDAPETEAEPEAEEADASEPESEAEAAPDAPEAAEEPEPEAPAEPEAAEHDAPESAEDAPLDPFEVFAGDGSDEPEQAAEEPEAPAESEPEVPSDEEAPSGGFFTEAPDLLDASEPEAPAEDVDTFVEDASEADEDEVDAEVLEEAAEAEEDADEDEAPLDDEEYDEEDAYDVSKLPPELGGEEDEYDEEEGPLTVTKVNTFLAILYFIIPGLVIGLPIFLVLLVLNLAFLVVAAVVLTTAVLLVITGLAPLSLPDRLLCFGSAAAALAVGLVLLWFTIWFFLCVTCGWVRLMTRGGMRLSRKEVEIE